MLEHYKTIYEGGEGELVEKKSRFIATVRPVETEEEALAFIEEMKKEFKYIILDTPPLQAVTDAQVLSTKADGVLLVVRAGSTKKDAILNSVDLIKKVQGKVIGTVLNGVENKRNNYYYYGE